ncbi:Rv1733c family protein [Virgisporangium ochraceum]|uniref:Transmembrane protein n=1 Tax=Virgisporangium ochraceum TaxID=65505 RepID=A0A8J4A4K4_9ACTN|nr:hypothetical protein [Virgisporangium ochraceum]GIJ72606.1 hypothetical protein Voc01_075230 [Virgisporangium ochraceum]
MESLRRCARRAGIGRNPLRRPTDRFETWFTVLLTIAVLVTAPFAVWWCAGDAYERATSAADRQRDMLFLVQAVLLADADRAERTYTDDGATLLLVPARWTAPDGTVRTGQLEPPAYGRAGSTVAIWTDIRGNPMQPPTSNPLGASVGVGLAVTSFAVVVYACVLAAVRRSLNRRRMAAWQREWRSVEPRWSGRR